MNVSEHYKRAARLKRLANKPAIIRAALRQLSADETRAIDTLIARAEALETRVTQERAAQRKHRAAQQAAS